MDFAQVIKRFTGALDGVRVRYALIGGFAMALRGLQRTTTDLDFIELKGYIRCITSINGKLDRIGPPTGGRHAGSGVAWFAHDL